jgi:hypothetical protein
VHIGAGKGDEERAVADMLDCTVVVVVVDEGVELGEGIEREG